MRVHLKLLSLLLIFQTFCVLMVDSSPVWHCGEKKETNKPAEKEFDPVNNYDCKEDFDINRKRDEKLIGLFVNTGKEDAVRSIGGTVDYGVMNMDGHRINYDKLKLDTQSGNWGSVGQTWDPVGFQTQVKNVTVPAGQLTLYSQTVLMCGYVRRSFIGGPRERVEAAVKVYANPYGKSFNLPDKCSDDLNYEEGAVLIGGNSGGEDAQIVANDKSEARVVTVSYDEGVQLDDSWELYKKGYWKDDVEQLASLLGANLAKMKSKIGLNWATYKVVAYGTSGVDVKLEVPPMKKMRAFQAVAKCGDLQVFGFVFPVYLPLTVDAKSTGECESPQLKPCMLYKRKDGRIGVGVRGGGVASPGEGEDGVTTTTEALETTTRDLRPRSDEGVPASKRAYSVRV